ncbi:MAG: DinB family protein [Anaerolineae bacterium]|nr:DinB family protein [Anaerolineae bacterium]
MPTTLTHDERLTKIARLRRFPDELEALVKHLSEAELYTAYIPGEWSVAQNVHHLPDSHMNAYVRTRLILTADNPPLVGYNQAAWAELEDYKLPIAPSLQLLRNLHIRWCTLFDSLISSDFARTGIHSEKGEVNLDDILVTYDNHCDAHIEQITRTLAAKNS